MGNRMPLQSNPTPHKTILNGDKKCVFFYEKPKAEIDTRAREFNK
jgi:hypothetical protein